MAGALLADEKLGKTDTMLHGWLPGHEMRLKRADYPASGARAHPGQPASSRKRRRNGIPQTLSSFSPSFFFRRSARYCRQTATAALSGVSAR